MTFLEKNLIHLFYTSDDVFRVSKPKWTVLFVFGRGIHLIHVPWDSPLVWHLLTSWQPALQLDHYLTHKWEQALVRLETVAYRAAKWIILKVFMDMIDSVKLPSHLVAVFLISTCTQMKLQRIHPHKRLSWMKTFRYVFPFDQCEPGLEIR